MGATSFVGGGGLVLSAYTGGACEARLVGTTLGGNHFAGDTSATTVLMGPQFYAESFGTSAMTLRLRNATLVGDPTGAHDFGIGLHTFIADGAAMTLDVADSIIDGASDSGTCSLWLPTLLVTSAGHNVVSPGCLPSPAATDIVLASTSPTPSAGLGVQVVTDLGFPYYPLTDGSPAIDAGDPSGCSDGDGGILTADALGRPRTGTCDAGAIER